MADVVSSRRARTISRSRAPRLSRVVRITHRYAGLTALAWLSVLGITGYVLDHHDWRWSHQWTVPEWLTSAPINRLVRGTVMRHVHVDPSNPARWIGASERGLWWTANRGETWHDIPYEGETGRAQVYRIVPIENGEPGEVWLATDDGLWTAQAAPTPAQRFALFQSPESGPPNESSTSDVQSRNLCVRRAYVAVPAESVARFPCRSTKSLHP